MPGVTRISVLHLQERLVSRRGGAIPLETRIEAIECASKVQAELRELGLRANVLVGQEVTGREAEQILQAAADVKADLVVASNHHKSRIDALLRGSTTRDIVRQSNLTVMLVPEHGPST
jgi:nucleotide-binding universal stress UspA family protein